MKKSNNKIKAAKKTAMAILGILVAILLFFQQPISSQLSFQEAHSDNKTEQNENPTKAEYRIMAYQLLIPVLQINLFHSADLIIEIPAIEKLSFSADQFADKVFHNFFHTLFRKIISPNAP